MGEFNYTAITGDLVASKTMDPALRARVQREILHCLADLDRDLERSLVRPFVLTAGDEVQGLLREPARIVETVQRLTDRLGAAELHEQSIVFGVGWGPLSTGVLREADSVERLDGPCFHLARAALTRAKKSKSWVVLEGFGEPDGAALNSLFELMGALRGGWTPIQARTTRDLRELGKRILVAQRHDVSPSVITESLQLSCFEAVRHGEQAARALLTRFDPESADGAPPPPSGGS